MSLVSAIEAPAGIASAIRKASQATGTDFGYLLQTAARESSFRRDAHAKTSSAAGLFQFIENTWLQTVKEEGARFGLDKYTPHIFKTRSGRYYVPNESLREEILQLRHNPEISAMMAGAFTQQNAAFVESEIGRTPTQGELYIAHFLGPSGAARLIKLSEQNPDARADRHFAKAARFNRGIFYSRGRPRSIAQVYNELVGEHSKLQTMAAGGTAASPKASPAALAQSAAPAASVDKAGISYGTVTGPNPEAKTPPDATLRQAAAKTGTSSGDAPNTEFRRDDAPKADRVRTIRVAALNTPSLKTKQATADPGLGSIGAWTTIIEPAHGAASNAAEAKQTAPAVDRDATKADPRAQPMRVGKPSGAETSARLRPRWAFTMDFFEENEWAKRAFEGN